MSPRSEAISARATGGVGHRLLAAALVAAPTAVVWATARQWRDRLPDPLPRHWGPTGRVTATVPVDTAVAVALGFTGAAAAVALSAALLPGGGWRARRAVLAVAGGVSGFAGGLWSATAALARDVTEATAVPMPTWHVPLLLAGTGLLGAGAWAACGRAPTRPAATGRPPADLRRVPLLAGERAAYTEIGSVPRAAYYVLVPVLAIALAVTLVANPWLAVPVLITVVVTVALLCTRLTVDRRGVTVGFGPWGWPRLRIPLREIAAARPDTVQVAEWGGWGYRIHPTGRGRGLILRSGPGVRLELSDDRWFVASVRDPDTVAGLVNSLLDQARPAAR